MGLFQMKNKPSLASPHSEWIQHIQVQLPYVHLNLPWDVAEITMRHMHTAAMISSLLAFSTQHCEVVNTASSVPVCFLFMQL